MSGVADSSGDARIDLRSCARKPVAAPAAGRLCLAPHRRIEPRLGVFADAGGVGGVAKDLFEDVQLGSVRIAR